MNPVFQQINARIFAARCSQLYPYPPMFHKNMELIYVTDGELELDQNGEVLRVRKGALCFTFPYAIHSNRNQRAEFIFISFDPGLCESFSAVLSNQTPRFPCLSGEALPEIVPLLLGRIVDICEKTAPHRDAAIIGYLSAILAECLPALDPVPSDAVKISTVQEILMYCGENILSNISLNQIAADLHISPNHISSIFSKKLKISLRDYINNLRISKAMHLLTHTEKGVTEIMQECGYTNQSTFNKTFLKISGTTPRQYRSRFTVVDLRDE